MPPPPPGSTVGLPGWRSLEGLTTALTILLYGSVALAVLGIAAYANRISGVGDILDVRFGDDLQGRADDSDTFVGVAIGVFGLISLAIVVLVIIWTFRAMKNNEYLGRWNARFTPGWGIAGWLIPLANLVIPVLIFQDLWRGSDVDSPRADPGWRQGPGSSLVGWWWAAWIAASLLGFRLRFGDDRAETPDELRDLRTSDGIGLAGLVASIVAAILFVQVLRRIAARQLEVRDRVY